MKILISLALVFNTLSACVGAPDPEPFPGGANGPGPRRLTDIQLEGGC